MLVAGVELWSMCCSGMPFTACMVQLLARVTAAAGFAVACVSNVLLSDLPVNLALCITKVHLTCGTLCQYCSVSVRESLRFNEVGPLGTTAVTAGSTECV